MQETTKQKRESGEAHHADATSPPVMSRILSRLSITSCPAFAAIPCW